MPALEAGRALHSPIATMASTKKRKAADDTKERETLEFTNADHVIIYTTSNTECLTGPLTEPILVNLRQLWQETQVSETLREWYDEMNQPMGNPQTCFAADPTVAFGGGIVRKTIGAAIRMLMRGDAIFLSKQDLTLFPVRVRTVWVGKVDFSDEEEE